MLTKALSVFFIIRMAKILPNGLAKKKTFFFSITSYFENAPSKLVIEAVEDCEIIMLSKEGTEKLRRSNIEIANLMIAFFSVSLILSQQRMESLQFETALQRYHKLLDEQPEILNKVPLQYIASFLGITQETLSRIRAKK